MDVSAQDNVPHVQAKFKSTNERYIYSRVFAVFYITCVFYYDSFTVPDHPFSIPQSLDHEELNKLVNEIVGGCLCNVESNNSCYHQLVHSDYVSNKFSHICTEGPLQVWLPWQTIYGTIGRGVRNKLEIS